jgi:hypothetical protein
VARKTKNTTQEDTVTDEFEIEDEPTEATADTPAKETAAKKKDPVPEGWETPTAFAHRLTEESNPFKPQMVYGYVKNGKDFPQKTHTDGRFIVEIEPALAWINERVEKRKAREAAKAAKEAEAETAAVEG